MNDDLSESNLKCAHPNLKRSIATLTFTEQHGKDKKLRTIARRPIYTYDCPDCKQNFPHDPRPPHLRKPFPKDE